eukprot:CAMPEP_0177281810 /NCGR_PEP_ID=MMETSP0367-20130122/71113_1 /TAXON_ID=447022 ORGANISM="Scrippsiella hangoei-like, Strain SHHI-4" /NCGR_SAMPLE_ID=MMETSP0367 /ASSEMBLY_ACC=CAM_ASM_000362 /LENGTH=47 /DNA_ID= /DNA_START= /DNA_END= /DNA_ORIENTATION=
MAVGQVQGDLGPPRYSRRGLGAATCVALLGGGLMAAQFMQDAKDGRV